MYCRQMCRYIFNIIYFNTIQYNLFHVCKKCRIYVYVLSWYF